MFLSIGANQGEEVSILSQVRIVQIHDLHLAPVNAFESKIDIIRCEKIKLEMSFRLAQIGDATVTAPGARALRWGGKAWHRTGNFSLPPAAPRR
jgi:hypothetical protein